MDASTRKLENLSIFYTIVLFIDRFSNFYGGFADSALYSAKRIAVSGRDRPEADCKSSATH